MCLGAGEEVTQEWRTTESSRTREEGMCGPLGPQSQVALVSLGQVSEGCYLALSRPGFLNTLSGEVKALLFLSDYSPACLPSLGGPDSILPEPSLAP